MLIIEKNVSWQESSLDCCPLPLQPQFLPVENGQNCHEKAHGGNLYQVSSAYEKIPYIFGCIYHCTRCFIGCIDHCIRCFICIVFQISGNYRKLIKKNTLQYECETEKVYSFLQLKSLLITDIFIFLWCAASEYLSKAQVVGT